MPLLILLGLLLLPHTAAAQAIAPLAPSNRLIIRGYLLPSRGLRVGVLENRGDTVLVQPDGWRETLTVPTGHIHRIQISRGRRPNTGLGMVIGGFTGLVVGFGLSGSDYLTSTMSGALVGIALGAAAGAAIRSEKWGPVVPLRMSSGTPEQTELDSGGS